METKTFQIIGSFKAGRSWERFTKKVSSNNEKNAAEKLYSLIGSEHGLKRNLIRIESILVEEA
jgi:large subunit ribosomal protein LX